MPERIEVRGAGKPGTDFVYEKTFAESMIESLQQQRTKYVQDGMNDLVQKVDETIDYYRGDVAPAAVSGQDQIVQAFAAAAAVVPSEVVDAPPHEGWVRDRVTGAWREPRKPGRPRPAGDIKDVEV